MLSSSPIKKMLQCTILSSPPIAESVWPNQWFSIRISFSPDSLFANSFLFLHNAKLFLLENWPHRKFAAISRKCCKLQYFVVRDARMYCKLQHFCTFEKSKSQLPMGLFSSRFPKHEIRIGKPHTRQSKKKQTRFLIFSFPIGFFKLQMRREKRPMKEAICEFQKPECIVNYNTLWTGMCGCIVNYNTISMLQQNFVVASNPVVGMSPFAKIKKSFQKALFLRSDSHRKTIDLAKF